MLIIFSFLLFLITVKIKEALWLVFPLGLFWDFWTMRPLGQSVLFLLFGWLIFKIILGNIRQDGSVQP